MEQMRTSAAAAWWPTHWERWPASLPASHAFRRESSRDGGVVIYMSMQDICLRSYITASLSIVLSYPHYYCCTVIATAILAISAELDDSEIADCANPAC